MVSRSARAARPVSSTAGSPTGRCPSSSCSPPTWTSATTTDSCSRSASSWPRWSPSAASSSRTRRRTGGRAHVDPLAASDDPTDRRALRKNPPAVKQYTPMEAIKTGILPLMWFVLLCTAGINIFGIAMQVPFGKEMGFAGGIVALGDEPQGDRQRHRARRDRLDLRPVRTPATRSSSSAWCSGWPSSRCSSRAPSAACRCSCLASMVSGFGGGAIFPLFAAMTADYFGENNNATNYGLVYSSKVISGLVGAGIGSVVVGSVGLRRGVHHRRLGRHRLRVHHAVPASAQAAGSEATPGCPPTNRDIRRGRPPRRWRSISSRLRVTARVRRRS